MGRKIGGAFCLVGAISLLVLVIIGEVVVPQMITSGVHQLLVKDVPSEIADWCEPNMAANVSITLKVFNLTNAYALQTVTPAPKPHFEAIDVEFTQMGTSFDCRLLDEGKKIEYHDWSKWVPTNPHVYGMEFVQVNPAYLGTIGALAPSEAMLLLGLSHNILGSVKKAMGAFGAGVLASGTGAERAVGHTLGENLSTAEDVGAAQFGTSAVTNLMGSMATGIPPSLLGFTSVASDVRMQAAGVCTPIELGAYMNDVTAGPFAPGGMISNLLLAKGFKFSSFGMSVAEATSFFARFSDATGADALGAPNWVAVLGQLAKGYAAALQAGNTTAVAGYASKIYSTTAAPGALFAPTFGTLTVEHVASGTKMPMCSSSTGGDFCPILAAAYATYLTSFLPERFFIGCQLLGCADSSCMKADGTFPLNSGLFTRLTLRQMLHDGNSDRLFAVAPAEAVPEGVTLEYNGLLGQYASMDVTLDDLRAAETDLAKYSSVQLSGKSDVTRVREWVEYKGKSLVQKGDASYPGWGTDGTPGEPFDFSGLRSLNHQAPQTKSNSPIAMATKSHKSSPNFGTSIDFLLTMVSWPVTLVCGSETECDFHQVKGIQTKKFTVPNDLLNTKKAGVAAESCRGTVSKAFAATYPGTTRAGSTCDFLQRHDGVINMEVARGGAPLAVTHGLLGLTNASVRNAVSITQQGKTSEIYYDASKDELALFVEPITGAVITGYERLQTNWYIEKSTIDTARYANVFSADTDNSDVFVWPFMYIKKEPAITDSGAKEFISGIYGKYDLGYHFDLLGMLFCVVCLVLGAICFKVETFSKTLSKSRDDRASGTAAPQTQDAPPETSV